jgi:folylpolyglutamate synthase/dihydropteroate synthase
VFGVLRDKDAAGILQPLLGRARRVILTAFASPRAVAPADLRALIPAALPVAVASSIGEAVALADEAPAAPLVCVTGALAFVGAALGHLDGADKPCPVENAADSIGPLS